MLREYTTRGCTVQTGEDWTAEQLQAAMDKELHSLALKNTIAQIHVEVPEKEAQGFAKICRWEDLKNTCHTHSNVCPSL